ncbi:putative olfactory receptor 14L1 [Tupaia chinensis]|uniref:Olfactory receptor n=1 Tax=Tupaia chinensis TaxID=246437 RepID=L8Y1C1_TUPCH|nr:putative olfactory receptor 14L1 [Tupaia chinensis]ELV10133.1 Putative olfactory receptor 14L1 [Tupaia chinensis]
MANRTTSVTEFILMGFSDSREWQVLQAVLFLLIYLTALAGNLLILLTTLDCRFQSPMYFFLRTLSLLDLCFISVTVPKSIIQSLTQDSSISFAGCVMQVFLVVWFACAELALLTVMSYDRYVAICRPLHYQIIMKKGACGQMAAASWLSGAASGFLNTSVTFSLPFCRSNFVHQFFCEIPSLLKLSCSEEYLAEIGAIFVTTSLGILCFISILISYIHIFSTVLRIPSMEGRSKAFSTCIPHIVVVTVFLSTGSTAYLKPVQESPAVWDMLVSVFYTMVPPTLNPIIYSLKNKDMKAAFQKVLRKTMFINPTNHNPNTNTKRHEANSANNNRLPAI